MGGDPPWWWELNERALASLEKWVPALFPTAKRNDKGIYRVAAADLGRGFQEDLSLAPAGIVFWGVADMGDPQRGRRTPIDCVQEWAHLEFEPAAQWLRQRLDGFTDAGDHPADGDAILGIIPITMTMQQPAG